jgi:hypothetical protein
MGLNYAPDDIAFRKQVRPLPQPIGGHFISSVYMRSNGWPRRISG